MDIFQPARQFFHFLDEDLYSELKKRFIHKTLDAKQELIREGQYVKYIPIVLTGSIKVHTMNEDRELLYYLIRPGETCIMSFSTLFNNNPSKVFLYAEEPSEIALVPLSQISEWIRTHPEMNQVFYQEYERRYAEMMEMLYKVIFYKLDRRLMDYLLHKTEADGKNPIKISHRDIANQLGTAREVVSRILKKFEQEGNIKLTAQGIEVLKPL